MNTTQKHIDLTLKAVIENYITAQGNLKRAKKALKRAGKAWMDANAQLAQEGKK